MTKHSLTHKQQTVFHFIKRYLSEHRMSPLIREIQYGCQIASYKSALDRLNALERKGLIKRQPNKHRGIRLGRRVLPEVGAVLATPELSIGSGSLAETQASATPAIEVGGLPQ